MKTLLTMKILRFLTIGSVEGENQRLAVRIAERLFQKKCDIIRGWVRALRDAVMKKLLGSQALYSLPSFRSE